VLLQVGRQVIDTHAVDPCRTFVALHLRQRCLQILALDNVFHRRSRDRRAFETGFRRACFGLSGGGASGFTLRSGAQVQLDLILLPHGLHEIAALLASSSVQAFGGALPPVGSEEAPIEGLTSVRHSNGTCSFPAFRFHEWLCEVRREGISETRLTYRVHQRVDLLLLTFERQMIG
jgi:hypothetical protein